MNDRPNVILILADDMGFSDLGSFGGEINTPHLDRLASEGVRFSQFYNTARCSPSRASLLTGRHPHETGIGVLTEDDRPEGYAGELLADVPTVAERLKERGYATCLSGKWHLTNSMQEPTGSWPTRRGFDDFYGIIGGATDYFHPRGLWRNETKQDVPGDGYYFTTAVGEHAADFVTKESAEGTPFFLYLAFTAPHWPLHAPAEAIERYRETFRAGWDELRQNRMRRLLDEGVLGPESALSPRDDDVAPWDDVTHREWEVQRMAVYAAQIDLMDAAIGRVMDAVRDAGVEEDTLVLFLSDNGASAEHLPFTNQPYFAKRNPTHTPSGVPIAIGNEPGIWPGDATTFSSYGVGWANLSNAPFRRYKKWVHEGGIATPLIARWPAGALAKGTVQTHPFQLTDIVPTVLEATGGPNGEHPGESMLSACRGSGSAPHTLYWEHVGNCAVRRGDWKAVRAVDEPWELYDLANDRAELHDAAAEHPDLLTELVAEWKAWARRVGVIDWATYPNKVHG